MSAFEYVASIYSVVLALAAAKLLGALADTLKYRKIIDHYWVHTGWCITFLFILVALWVSIWNEVRGLEQATVFTILPYFFWVVLYYIGAHLLAPEHHPNTQLDLRSFFLEVKTPFLICLVTPYFGVVMWLAWLKGAQFETEVWFTLFLAWALAIAGAITRNHRAHAVILILYALNAATQELYQPMNL